MANSIITAHRVTKRIRDGDHESSILHDVSLDVEAGEWVALLGPSGSGKSSLLQILGALDPNYTGTVTINGTNLASLSDAARSDLRNRTLGFVFQAYNLLGHLTVLDNVMLPAHFASSPPKRGRAAAVLEQVGMGGFLNRRPNTLSGGERQRVAIARALYANPRVILCDEPTGNLDLRTGEEILDLFSQLQHQGVTLLMATHDMALRDRASRTLHILDGKLQEEAVA